MGVKIMMAGQDISTYVDESTIDIEMNLAQGSGTGNGTSSRAATFEFTTSLGPAGSAVGAGTTVHTPTLVRQGEVLVYDANNNLIYGGYATSFNDTSEYTRIYTDVTCVDYWQQLDRIVINAETFSGQTDIQIINYLITTYANWINLSRVPTTPSYQFTRLQVRSKSVQWALQKITDTVGYQMWVTPDKKLHYQSPLATPTAPFALNTTPVGNVSVPYLVTKFVIDDNSAINRVYFYGGRSPSADFTQDLSPQENGNNKVFELAYYPREASDGKVHVYKNGVELVLGYLVASPGNLNNVFKSQGGNADVLLNSDAHTLTFDIAPSTGVPLTCKYRYMLPLVVTMISQSSLSFYGTYLDAIISDDSVFSTQTAVQRCQALLLEQAFGLVDLEVSLWTPGLQPGQTIRVDHAVRGIHGNYVIQQVKVVPQGGGKFQYDCVFGAWNWNLTDVLLQIAQSATPENDNTEQDNTPVAAFAPIENKLLHEAWSNGPNRTAGGYYARATAVGDGHDAYPGFFSVTS